MRLRETMSHLPEASSSPFVRRRLRLQLLERVARDGWSVPRPGRGRFGIALTAAVLVVCTLMLGFSMSRFAAPLPGRAPPLFAVEDIHLASWSQEQLGDVTRLRLSSGSAAFQVHRLEQRQRFLLLLPDGEIEVHGTRFLVDLIEDRTAHVSVTEGVVSLRLRAEPERLLHAGESWSQPTQTDEPVATTSVPIPASPSGKRLPVPVSHLSEGEATTHQVPPTLDSFATGVSAFEAGDYRRADESFRRFLAETPSDPRGEDASFLRALAHARWGDKQGAAELAENYLVQFPSGLRRREAERLLGRATSPGQRPPAAHPSTSF